MIDLRTPRSVFVALLLVLAFVGGAAAEVDPVSFERYEAVLGSPAHRVTILTGIFLGGDVSDLAAVHVDRKGDRNLQIYQFRDGRWQAALNAKLGRKVGFVDVASVDGVDRLITFQRGRFNWFDPQSATERQLLEVGADFRSTDSGWIPSLDVTRDLNGDGRDDIIMPAVDGFWVSTQASDGTFAEAMRLGPPEPFAKAQVGSLDLDESRSSSRLTYGDVGITEATLPVYLTRFHQIDHDLDGRKDLVFWNQDHFDVYHQDEYGRFEPSFESFAVEAPFDSDGLYSYLFEFSGDGAASVIFGFRKKTERTVLHSFRDLNGDGIADLVTLTLTGRGAMRQRSIYQAHFGSATSDGLRFASDVSTTFAPGGRAGAGLPWGYASEWFEDLDGDGRTEMVYSYVPVGVSGIVRTLTGKSVPVNLELFRLQDGRYSEQPATTRRFRRFAPFAGFSKIFFPAVLVGDVNGDERLDLVVGEGPEELHVFPGLDTPELLARTPQRIAVSLPGNEERVWLSDLDGDGRQDLLVHHGPTDNSPDEPHRIMTLFAR